MLIEENIEKQTGKNHLLSHYSTMIIVYFMLDNKTHLFFCVSAYIKKQNFQDLTLSSYNKTWISPLVINHIVVCFNSYIRFHCVDGP